MTYRALTVEEDRYLSQGGRVFLVGNENEVVILRKDAEPRFLGDHETLEPYKFPSEEIALRNAWATSCLSADKPMVEGVIVGALVNPPKHTLRT